MGENSLTFLPLEAEANILLHLSHCDVINKKNVAESTYSNFVGCC